MQLYSEKKYKHSYLIKDNIIIKLRLLIGGPIAQLVRAVHS